MLKTFPLKKTVSPERILKLTCSWVENIESLKRRRHFIERVPILSYCSLIEASLIYCIHLGRRSWSDFTWRVWAGLSVRLGKSWVGSRAWEDSGQGFLEVDWAQRGCWIKPCSWINPWRTSNCARDSSLKVQVRKQSQMTNLTLWRTELRLGLWSCVPLL